jgi:flagella basal body P-ring formation protein FlgA
MWHDYLAGFLVLAAVSSSSAADVKLADNNLVSGDAVTVGDLFTNTGEYASHRLALAPKVGEKTILSKADLQRISDAFKFGWKAPEGDLTVALERDASLLGHDAITAALDKSDLKDKINSEASFKISEPAEAVLLDGKALPELNISETAFDPATERFTAKLEVSRNGSPLKTIAVSGIATPMAHVPVLLHPLAPNSVISVSDIVEKTIPKRDLRAGTILSAAELAGLSPKRTLQAGQAISALDVSLPLLVKRNELVTVIYRNGPVMLSTKARALANGARGETVTMMNINSKKPFDARITGPQQAEVLVESL